MGYYLLFLFSRCKETKKNTASQRKIPTLRGNFPKDTSSPKVANCESAPYGL